LQRRTGGRNLAAILLHEDAGELHHVLRLVAEKADRLDMLDEPLFAQVQHLLRRVRHLEERARGLVDASIGGLRG
jgi:hypothetical protein